MEQPDHEYSTQEIKPQLISQIIDALKNKAYGSVEIYIQNYRVTQITERTITKVNRNGNGQKKFVGAKTSQVSSQKDKLTI